MEKGQTADPVPCEVDDFRLFADSIPSLAWMANADGYITWYNRRWHEYCGTTAQEMEGWGWQSVHDPRELESVLERWRSSIGSGRPFEMTFPLKGADGKFRSFLTRAVPHFDELGKLVRWFGTNTDLSPELQAKAALRAAQADAEARATETSAILSQLAEGVIVTDPAGKITFVNEAAVALHGVRTLDIGPDDYSEGYHLLTEDGDPYPPQDLPLSRAVRGERVLDARWRVRRPDGREVVAIGNAHPIIGADGRQLGAVLTVRDDTARHQAEHRLRLSERALTDLNETLEQRIKATVAERQILADVVESTDASIGVLDLNYTILAINRANIEEFERVYGIRPRVGDNMLELLDDQPEHREQVKRFWSRALRGEEYSFEEEFGTVERVAYSIKFNVLRDATGRQIGAFNFVTDVSQQRRDRELLAEADERIKQAQKIEAIGQLTGGVAHDFNNLLMVLSGGIQMIEGPIDPAKRERVIGGMRQAVERGAGLSRQLLAFSRRQPLKPVVVDLFEQIDAMRELLDGSLRGDVHVRTEFQSDLWPVEIDPGELELVVLNLAVNARDAMPQGGTIILRAENLAACNDPDVPGDVVRLSVIDEGVGMPPEVVARVFEPFFTTKEIGKGSGLGLAQAYGFAKSSNGVVRVQSVVGKGTTIALLLPRATGGATKSERPSVKVPPSNSFSSGMTILVVEDDQNVGEMVVDLLGQLGHTSIRASNATSALGALANGRNVDIVLSDVMMPGSMNGVELAREIRSRRPGLPILLNSGYSGTARAEAEAMGLKILVKPFTLEELQAAIFSAVGVGGPGNLPDADGNAHTRVAP